MMIAAYKNNTYGKRIPIATRRDIAVQAFKSQQTVSDISKTYGCSRTTVYKQQNKVVTAVNKAFEDEDDDTILFYIPITKSYIKQAVTSLFLICKSSYRDIIFFLKTMFDYTLSLGSVFAIIDEASDKASCVNQSYDLSSIKTGAADEKFHRNKPFLAVVDIESRFCPLLVKEERRDYETWGIHLLDLQACGFAPNTMILDGAKGLVKGHEVALPGTKLRRDHFHILKDLKDCARFINNQEASRVTATLKLYTRTENARDEIKKMKFSAELAEKLTQLSVLEETRHSFSILVQWLQHDVLQLAGHPPMDRAILYDFIVDEMSVLATTHPHRITDIVTSLKTQREALLDVAHALNDKFLELAKKHKILLEMVWKICYTTRYSMDSIKYGITSCELESLIGDEKYDAIEDEVLLILEGTHRCSSMVENLNSRLRPYLDEKKEVTQKTLGLVRFYLNHKPFMRSYHKHLVNKTPAEAMTGKVHKPWLELIGYTPFQRKVA